MNRRIIIIGSSGDIGSAIAERLAGEGYKILGLDIVPPKKRNLLEQFFYVDLNDTKDVEIFCRKICKQYSSFWALVYCAGIYPIKIFKDYTLDIWDEVHTVNLRSAFQIIHILHPMIIKGGRIVLISSGAAHIGSRDIGYSSSKAGVIGLVQGLAKVLAQREILVNAVCPGVIRTRMSAKMSKKHINEYIKIIPLRRIGLPKEVAVCISFLLNKDNTYITGASIDVNGGLYTR